MSLSWELEGDTEVNKTYAVLEGTGTLTQGIVKSLLDKSDVENYVYNSIGGSNKFALKLRGYTAIGDDAFAGFWDYQVISMITKLILDDPVRVRFSTFSEAVKVIED